MLRGRHGGREDEQREGNVNGAHGHQGVEDAGEDAPIWAGHQPGGIRLVASLHKQDLFCPYSARRPRHKLAPLPGNLHIERTSLNK